MRNWAGQEITVGAAVWRGARDGNTSSFSVGRVVALNEHHRTARVRFVCTEWAGTYLPYPVMSGTSVDTLALIDPATLSAEIRALLNDDTFNLSGEVR